MDGILLTLDIVIMLILAAVLIRLLTMKGSRGADSEEKDLMQRMLAQTERNLRADIAAQVKEMNESLLQLQKASADAQYRKLNDIDRQLNQKLGDLKAQMDREHTALKSEMTERLETIQQTVDRKLQRTLDERMTAFGQMLTMNQKQASEAQQRQIAEMASKIDQNIGKMSQSVTEKQEQSGKALNASLVQLEQRFKSLEANNEQKLENMRTTMTRQLTSIQEENQRKLDSIQSTVNEKLETQLQKSFHLVSEQLETVHKSLGEMQSIASGVGDLKRVLSNVKTRGILGEIQLGNILGEILAPEQYDTEVPTVKDSKERVEFAIRLPGRSDGKPVYLPIDSKFPGDTYQHLLDAYDSGDKAAIEEAKKVLTARIRACAKDISTKYVAPPDTTNFAIMFLPFEGLYAEVVKLGLIEPLQREYHVNITGPSTMAAMLNSLQMGFQTLAIQKKSSEVWEVLGAVKKEFGTFQDVLDKAQKQILNAGESIDKLIGTRTRAINRKLRTVEVLDDDRRVQALLDVDEEM